MAIVAATSPQTPLSVTYTTYSPGARLFISLAPNLSFFFSNGVDPEYAERIFLIFQRLHTKDKYPGTGIGLAICKKIAKDHGGNIWLESAPGQGATFTISIPRQIEAKFDTEKEVAWA